MALQSQLSLGSDSDNSDTGSLPSSLSLISLLSFESLNDMASSHEADSDDDLSTDSVRVVTRKPSWNAPYSATASRAWRVLSASTAWAKTGSFTTAARNTPCGRCLHASSSPASEGKSQYGVRAQRHNGQTEADCQSMGDS